MKNKKNKKMPILLKILGVLTYIGAGFLSLLGLIFIFASKMMSELISQDYFKSIGVFGFIFIGFVLIGVGIFEFYIARGYYKSENWSRVVTIVFSIIGVIFAIIGIFKGLVSENFITLIVDGFLIYYFTSAKECKEWFLN